MFRFDPFGHVSWPVPRARVAALVLVSTLVAGPPVAALQATDGLPPEAIGLDRTAEIDRWVGTWRSLTDTTSDGRAFRFRYALERFGPTGKLFTFTIRQVFEDGEDRLLWTGAKGWDPLRRVTFNDQMAPGGIVGRGVYVPDPEGKLVIRSRGAGPGGPIPPIMDASSPLEGGGFRTVTSVLRDGAWVETRVDVWSPWDEAESPGPPGATGGPGASAGAEADPDAAAAALRRLVGSWEITPVASSAPTGRLDVRWLPGGRTLQKAMRRLDGPGTGPASHGVIGFDPASGTLRGIDFQSMIWPENRRVDLVFESEYWADDGWIRRIYTVRYPPGEPLMPDAGRGGVERRYRETLTFEGEDAIRWETEIDRGGRWEPFGNGGSRLRRLGDPGRG